jgi:hypothetical protein
MADLFNRIMTTESSLVQLLGDSNNTFVGYVYCMRFNEAFVLTNDHWKHTVGGIPHNSFLVAAGFNPERYSDAPTIDQEVVLLRVLEPASLPQDNDFLRTLIEHHQRRTPKEMMPGDVNDGMDPMTASELQSGGLKCSILGTFYMEGGHLRLGSDIENFMSLSRMRAYKPTGDALSLIVNHVNPEVRQKAKEEAIQAGFSSEPSPIKIGTVRYTSTARMHRGQSSPLVDVLIQPTDFLARRTAVLGMTRTGKSNTVKTTVSAVAIAALRDGINVGQLIFDVNGEYANANHQDDGSSIADVFPNQTVRYRPVDTKGFEDLRSNFYLECTQAMHLIQALFKAETSSPYSGQDLDGFMSSSLDEPDPLAIKEHTRWRRHIAVFQCILHRASYPLPPGHMIEVPLSKALITQVQNWAGSKKVTITIPTQGKVEPDEACAWYELIRSVNLDTISKQRDLKLPVIGLESSTKGSSAIDPTLEGFLNMLARENSLGRQFAGWRAIQKYQPYHSARRAADITKEIINHLDSGRIVILDLSVGPKEIREVLSKRIAGRIFDRQMSTMHAGKIPQNMVLYVEEAHNLVGRTAELTDTWPRLAKEGAKARIAFVYATQEPSSVHPNILANTENWFVTHLNNDDELKTLGKFYDYSDFIRSLKAAQDVGFARIKTLSSPFVIPTQINRFTPETVRQELALIMDRKNGSSIRTQGEGAYAI